MIWIIIAILAVCLTAAIFVTLKKENKRIEKNKPTFRYDYETLYLFDSGMEDKFIKFYKDELYENDEYNYTAKELKEDYLGEKVYKYAPYDLPFMTEGDEVYSKLNEEWVRVGKIKSRDVEKLTKGEVTLALYPKIYKYVTEEGIERVNDDPYFALTVKTKVDL